MLGVDKITEIAQIAQGYLKDTDLFLISVKELRSGEFEVLIDGDSSVSIESCVELNRAIQKELDSDEYDFALTVSSAGIGQPLKVLRQYTKLIGRPVEVVLKSGIKVVATLKEATEEQLTLSYPEMVVVEGSKRKQEMERVDSYTMEQIKSTVEHLDFK